VAAELEFGLLGPLEVRREGVLVPIAAGRQRALLAALLLGAGRLVRADELIDVLWDGAPPASARPCLHNYVKRLLIATRPPGYLITVEPRMVDAARFEELQKDARTAARDGSWQDASGRARAALALWRGDPLVDAGSEALAAREAPRLAEIRLQALEVAVDAELHLGGQDAVLGELRRLVAEHPMRERLHALLMLALYRDGRRGEALAVYRDARRVLVGELGVEPGAGLQDLHQRILVGDVALAVAAPGQQLPGGKPVATWTLPRDIAGFAGRQDELARLTAAAAGASGVVGIQAISGMAGVGKTALAVHAAHMLALRFPDGQLFVPLHGHTQGYRPVDPADALAGLLVTAGFAVAGIPPGLLDRAGLWRDYLAGKRVLLVLDDAVSSDQVEPLLPGTGGSLVLVSSRRHLTALPDARVISLDVLPEADAAALLVRLAARPGMRPDDPVVVRICTLCGYLPLAVAILAGQLRHHPAWTPAGLAGGLATARDRLDAMAAENVSVAAAFDLSYADLGPAQRQLFRRLGLHPGSDIDAYAAAALDDCTLAEARRGLQGLYDHGLLAEPAAGRYRLHDLLREHARARVFLDDPAGDRDQAAGRLLDYYTHTASVAERHLARQTPSGPAPILSAPPTEVPDLTDSAQALAWARAERANLLACLDLASASGQHARVADLTAALAGLLRLDGPWTYAADRHAAAVDAASQSGDRAGRARALNNLAIVQSLTGNHQDAAWGLQKALGIYRGIGDPQGEANALHSLGFVRYRTRNYPRAARDLEAALALSLDLGDRRGQANALVSLGFVRRETGDFPAAALALQKALRIYRDLADGPGQANALNYLGTVRTMMGDYPGAAQALKVALALNRDLASRPGQANALVSLGIVRRETGDYPAAIRALQEALRIYCDIGNRQGQANALHNLGFVRCMTGEYPAAALALQEALSIYRNLGDRAGEAEALNETGILHRAREELDEAQACHRQALELARDIATPWDEAHAQAGLGRCALAVGRSAEAEASLGRAHQIFARIGAAEEAAVATELDALREPVSSPRRP
jgi:DNA-binding SARP family transcriptional activator/tetratricopeptide (TPR) repeat protein